MQKVGTMHLDSCAHRFEKRFRLAFAMKWTKSEGTLDAIHSKVWGLMKLRLTTYTFYDISFTKKMWIYCVKGKSEGFYNFI